MSYFHCYARTFKEQIKFQLRLHFQYMQLQVIFVDMVFIQLNYAKLCFNFLHTIVASQMCNIYLE